MTAQGRKDYDRLISLCTSGELDPAKYFVQTIDSDPGYRMTYAHVLLNGTKYIRAGQEHLKVHAPVGFKNRKTIKEFIGYGLLMLGGSKWKTKLIEKMIIGLNFGKETSRAVCWGLMDAYDQWLAFSYGDYMKLPPEEKRVIHQTFSTLDFGVYE